MQAELDALEKALVAPQRPLAAIVGGAKVSTKLELLGNLIAKVNVLIIGGGMANTFLLALGKNIGKSLAERDLVATARDILIEGEGHRLRDRAAGRCGGGAQVRGQCALAGGRRRRASPPTR